jgi:hypothetical protein
LSTVTNSGIKTCHCQETKFRIQKNTQDNPLKEILQFPDQQISSLHCITTLNVFLFSVDVARNLELSNVTHYLILTQKSKHSMTGQQA